MGCILLRNDCETCWGALRTCSHMDGGIRFLVKFPGVVQPFQETVIGVYSGTASLVPEHTCNSRFDHPPTKSCCSAPLYKMIPAATLSPPPTKKKKSGEPGLSHALLQGLANNPSTSKHHRIGCQSHLNELDVEGAPRTVTFNYRRARD